MEKIIIGRKEFLAEERELPHTKLFYYPENPRVYSILNIDGGIPEQSEIESKLQSMEHVKQLKLSIEQNGGVIDPLIVRGSDYVVLEGNSRLAAYRLLAKRDPIKWGVVKCKVILDNISDSEIFTLLGQYHIIGRKDWSPYEQAGYLYRRIRASGVSEETIALELGIPKSKAKNYINVYSFMTEYEDFVAAHWSHYEEYLKNRSIKKYRESFPNLDRTIANMIKNEQIVNAIDIRNKLGNIAKLKTRTAKKIMFEISEGLIDIYEGFSKLEDTGAVSNAYQTLNRFRQKICDEEFIKQIQKENKEQIVFELKKIQRAVEKILREFINGD